MNKIVAVSGGVDSVVLLDILADAQSNLPKKIIVAHVDHGIRPESGDDRQFVEGLARQYRLPFFSTQLKLGASASEEEARRARYDFLFELAEQHQAVIATAHHQDDLVGSMAINIKRGTGWRGLAVMNRSNIERPLLGWTKQSIYRYATSRRLEWVEDATNASDKYLRNRLRGAILAIPPASRTELVNLRADQLQLARDIDFELRRAIEAFADSRYRYSAIDPLVAVELLRSRFSITRPQAERVLLAIKTARPGTKHVIDSQHKLRFSKTDFIVDSHP